MVKHSILSSTMCISTIRKGILLLSFMVTASILYPQTSVLAVIEFQGKGIPQVEASALTDRLRTEIIKIGGKKVVEREEMDEVLKEQGLQQSGCVSSECLVEVGQLLGANQILSGSISKVGNTFSVSARIIDIETGEIINSINYDYNGLIEELLVSGMRNVAQLLLSPYTGVFVEQYKDVEYYQNGRIKSEGTTIARKKHGRWVYYYENGRLQKVGNYKDGKKVGKWTYYGDNGQVVKEGNYMSNQMCGMWMYYDENGNVKFSANIPNSFSIFRLPIKIMITEYYDDSNVKSEYEITTILFKREIGFLSGERTVYSVNGEVLDVSVFNEGQGYFLDVYDNGMKKVYGYCANYEVDLDKGIVNIEKSGKWSFWDEKGNLISEKVYEVKR